MTDIQVNVLRSYKRDVLLRLRPEMPVTPRINKTLRNPRFPQPRVFNARLRRFPLELRMT